MKLIVTSYTRIPYAVVWIVAAVSTRVSMPLRVHICMIAAKLKEFNSKVSPTLQCDEEELGSLAQFCQPEGAISDQMYSFLWKLLKWPEGGYSTS